MWNPFVNKQKEQIQEMQDKEANLHLQTTVLGTPSNNPEDIDVSERRNMLLQLSQWQQDRGPSYQKVFLEMCGYRVDPESKTLKENDWSTKYTTLAGAQKLIMFVEPLDHNVMLGSWNEDLIYKYMREGVAHPLRRFIVDNHNELGLDLQHAEYVINLLLSCVEPNFMRGLNDGERRKDREIIKVNEIRNPYAHEIKKGLFGVNKT